TPATKRGPRPPAAAAPPPAPAPEPHPPLEPALDPPETAPTGWPAAAASFGTAAIAARARSSLARPAGGGSLAAAAVPDGVRPCTPYPFGITTSSSCLPP